MDIRELNTQVIIGTYGMSRLCKENTDCSVVELLKYQLGLQINDGPDI